MEKLRRRLILPLKAKLTSRDFERTREYAYEIGYVKPEAVKILTRSPRIIAFEQEFFDAKDSGDPERIARATEREEQLSPAEKFAVITLLEQRAKEMLNKLQKMQQNA